MVKFDDATKWSEEHWHDDQATSFKYTHVERVSKALSDMQLDIEHIIDLVDSRLEKIRSAANS